MSELSPWPMTVEVDTDVFVNVTGVSGNSYVIDGRIGIESLTIANEANVEAELPELWLVHTLDQTIECPPDPVPEVLVEPEILPE
jgi:hypothetical protein